MCNQSVLILWAIVFFLLGFFPLWIFSRMVTNKLINKIEELKKELKQCKEKQL